MNFHQLSQVCLENLAEIIEAKDRRSSLEIECLDGILKIVINKNKKTFIINRNAGNQKIWYSSPFSGADYFSHNISLNSWVNANNVELSHKLLLELQEYLS